ncbi:hypothetical protein OHD16_06735 [Sphingobacterium sp. ML3W]|uniref:hypothetical protein n=1 Tax=Sphingobacterium sp. ML3W TaxID=1538644 RepID=UPI00249CA2C3|nr:hypothetical protein [Sphingobacterium sp. ML3W]WFA79665.1 hypothetical protein OGI71_26975 [Sphingobacterium sp. ML3W]
MAVKYTIPFKDDANALWKVDIDLPSYNGEPIELVGVGRTFCAIDYGASSEDPYEPIWSSSVTIQFYNKNGEVDLRELQLLSDLEGRLKLYKGDTLKWSGYILPDGIQRLMSPNPYTVSLTATDGLQLLNTIPFNGLRHDPLVDGMSVICPLAYVREILFHYRHLGIIFPIRWTSAVESVFHNDDGFAGNTGWGSLGDAWKDLNENNRSCMYVLSGILLAFQMHIYQWDGKWLIERINNVFTGVYPWKEINTAFDGQGVPTLTTGISDVNKEYSFVNENQVMMIKPSLTDMEVTYDYSQAENNLPNGGFDKWFQGDPINWYFQPITEGVPPLVKNHPSLSDRPGLAADLTNYTENNIEAVFTLIDNIPVDSNILFKRFLLGFTFMPLFGFTFNNQTGFIDWNTNPLKISVSFIFNNKTWYLNEFGYWWNEDTATIVQKFTLGWDLPAKSYLKVIFSSTLFFNPGDTVEISFLRNGVVENHPFTFDTLTTPEEALTRFLNEIPNSQEYGAGAQYKALGIYDVSDVPENYVKTGKTLESIKKINISVDSLKINDIATVVFSGKGGNSEILLPDMGPSLDGNNGLMNIQFFVKPGQEYVLDDAYFRFEQNNEVFKSSLETVKKTNIEKKSLNISSSFTGFMLSNIMSNFYDSNKEYKFTDGKYTGSLTGMTANAIMRLRYVPREVFQGDLLVRGDEWKVNTIYGIEGKKFLPLNSRYNIETGIVNVTALECEDGSPFLTEKRYGSNDTILSNT